MNFFFQYTPFKFFVQNLWRDEAFSFLLAQNSIINILLLTAKDFTPPLYYILLHIWMGIFGSSEISMRSISLLFFVATAYYVYDILTEICHIQKKKAFFYLLLIFLNPILTYYAFEARAYAMVTFFATAASYAFYTEKKRLYWIMSIFGLYTHYFMIFILLAHAVFEIIKNRKRSHLYNKAIQIAIPVIAWLPWMGYMISQRSIVGQSFWISKPHWYDIFTVIGLLYTGHEWSFTPLVNGITMFLSAFMIGGILYLFLQRKHLIKKNILPFYYFLLWGLVPPLFVFLLSFVSTPLYIPRYLVLATPGILLAIIFILEHVPTRVRQASLAVLFIITLMYQQYQITHKTKDHVKPMYQEIKAIAEPEDVVYVKDILDIHVAQYYFDKDKVYIYGAEYENIPSYIGKVLIPESLLKNYYPIHPQKAFVVEKNSYYIRSQY